MAHSAPPSSPPSSPPASTPKRWRAPGRKEDGGGRPGAPRRAPRWPRGLRRSLRRFAPARSIRNRLALTFSAIALVAIAAVYFYVAPSLGSRLSSQKLAALVTAAEDDSHPLEKSIGTRAGQKKVALLVANAAAMSNATVAFLLIETAEIAGVPVQTPKCLADSGQPCPHDIMVTAARYQVASDAARAGHVITRIQRGSGGPLGVAALPIRYPTPKSAVYSVVVYSESFSDVERTVALIRDRILLAGALALTLALVGGYLIARAMSLRVKRLEEGALRVAAGDFSAQFETKSSDELGQLGRALDVMQRQLAELDSARERFIAIASHELRTPIFSLGGYLELIQDEELDEDTRRQFIGQLREQIDRLGKLATGLLDLSRLEAGGLDLSSEVSDVGVVVRTATSEFVPALAQHSSRLRLRISDEPLLALCDQERVGQIMRILIDNALTHTPEGTDLLVTARRTESAEPIGVPGVRIAVRDYGPGVPEVAKSQIFEPFYTSDGVKGTGLGLAIGRELAERMHGSLTVESEPGRTVFTLDLPG